MLLSVVCVRLVLVFSSVCLSIIFVCNVRCVWLRVVPVAYSSMCMCPCVCLLVIYIYICVMSVSVVCVLCV